MTPSMASHWSVWGGGPDWGQRTGRAMGVASAMQQRTSNLANWGGPSAIGSTKPWMRTGSPS